MRDALVSIIVPAYNCEGTIMETLESLDAQTYPNLEIIIVDDGSRDLTGTIASEYVVDADHRMTYIRQENGGQASALNRGWTIAQGQYFAYLSADDTLYPEAITKLVIELERRKTVWVVYPDYDLIDAESRPIRVVRAPEFDAVELVEHSICQPGPGALFRRDAFAVTGGWNPKLRQTPDFDFWLRVCQHGDMIRLPECLAGFRVHEGSQSFSAPNSAMSEEPVQVMQALFKDAKVARRFKRRRALGWAHALSARLHLRGGRWRKACTHIAWAFSRDFRIVLQLRFWHLLGSGAFGRLRYQLMSRTVKSAT